MARLSIYFSMGKAFVVSAALALLVGCQTFQERKPFTFKQLAKSEIDMVTDLHMATVNDLSKRLLTKLYKLNPRELAKAPPGTTIESRITQLFAYPRIIRFAELGDYYANKAVHRAFDPEFEGDRVFALMVGVTGMLHGSYNYQREFFMLDALDQQKLYNSARNLETVAWLMTRELGPSGQPLIVSNRLSYDTDEINLSIERLFGKMIALQDMMAEIVADQNHRAINRVLHGVASTTLLPI
jgi:hypothetical protein